MRALLDNPKLLTFGADEYSGAGEKDGRWEPPEEITRDMIFTARAAVEEYTAKQQPAGEFAVIPWLERLCAGIPHAMEQAALVRRIAALAEAVEDYPAWVWTKETRKLAGARFGFVPASKELIEFAEDITAGPRSDAAKLMRILDTGERRAKRTAAAGGVWTPEMWEEHREREKARKWAELQELGRIIRERDAQAAAEKPASTVAEQISRTTKAMKAMKPAPAEAAE